MFTVWRAFLYFLIPFLHYLLFNCCLHITSSQEGTPLPPSPRFWLGHHSILSKKWNFSQSNENWYIAALDSIFYESEKKNWKKISETFFFKLKRIFFKKKIFQHFFKNCPRTSKIGINHHKNIVLPQYKCFLGKKSICAPWCTK